MSNSFKADDGAPRSLGTMQRLPAGLLTSLFTLAACGQESPSPSAAPPPAESRPTFVAGDCRLPALDGLTRPRACGHVAVAQARLAQPARRPADLAPVQLYVEHLPGTRADAPLIFLTGGPGVSLEAYASLGVLQKLLADRARGVILVEQRGNSLSAGGLSCAAGLSPSSCREALIARGVLPEAFNSRESAEDVAEVIGALGYARAAVWGHSYGSGLAQRVAQLHPERVAALILEGVSAPDRRDPYDALAHISSMLEDFGTWHRARCAVEPACRELYPRGLDPAVEVPQLLQLYEQDEAFIIPLTPRVGLDRELLVAWGTNGLASYRGMLLFTELVHAILQSSPVDRAPLDALVARLGRGDLTRGQGALEGFLAALSGAAATGLSGTVKTCLDLGRVGTDPECAGLEPDVYTRETLAFSLATDVPTLWLQGPLDTQTPITQAERLRSQFTQLTEALFAPCLGHFSYLDGGACADTVLESFLAATTGDVTACVPTVCESKPLTTTSDD